MAKKKQPNASPDQIRLMKDFVKRAFPTPVFAVLRQNTLDENALDVCHGPSNTVIRMDYRDSIEEVCQKVALALYAAGKKYGREDLQRELRFLLQTT